MGFREKSGRNANRRSDRSSAEARASLRSTVSSRGSSRRFLSSGTSRGRSSLSSSGSGFSESSSGSDYSSASRGRSSGPSQRGKTGRSLRETSLAPAWSAFGFRDGAGEETVAAAAKHNGPVGTWREHPSSTRDASAHYGASTRFERATGWSRNRDDGSSGNKLDKKTGLGGVTMTFGGPARGQKMIASAGGGTAFAPLGRRNSGRYNTDTRAGEKNKLADDEAFHAANDTRHALTVDLNTGLTVRPNKGRGGPISDEEFFYGSEDYSSHFGEEEDDLTTYGRRADRAHVISMSPTNRNSVIRDRWNLSTSSSSGDDSEAAERRRRHRAKQRRRQRKLAKICEKRDKYAVKLKKQQAKDARKAREAVARETLQSLATMEAKHLKTGPLAVRSKQRRDGDDERRTAFDTFVGLINGNDSDSNGDNSSGEDPNDPLHPRNHGHPPGSRGALIAAAQRRRQKAQRKEQRKKDAAERGCCHVRGCWSFKGGNGVLDGILVVIVLLACTLPLWSALWKS